MFAFLAKIINNSPKHRTINFNFFHFVVVVAAVAFKYALLFALFVSDYYLSLKLNAAYCHNYTLICCIRCTVKHYCCLASCTSFVLIFSTLYFLELSFIVYDRPRQRKKRQNPREKRIHFYKQFLLIRFNCLQYCV